MSTNTLPVITRILHPIKARRWNALRVRRDSIPGEPCGGTAMHCKNPLHGEYFQLGIEMDRVWNPRYNPFDR